MVAAAAGGRSTPSGWRWRIARGRPGSTPGTPRGPGGDPEAERDLLGRVRLPSGYASATVGGEVVAVGRAVAEDGWAGVFDMATLPGARGRGAARSVLAALARWAAARRAERLYLQVERGNEPALRLYERAGFREVCRYHYRTAP